MGCIDGDIKDDVHHASAVLTEHAGVAGVAVPYFAADVHVFDKAEVPVRKEVGTGDVLLRLRAVREVAEGGRVDNGEVFDDTAVGNVPEEALVADGRVFDGVTVAVKGAGKVPCGAVFIRAGEIAEDIVAFRHVDIRTEQIVAGNGILRRALLFDEGIEGGQFVGCVNDRRSDGDGHAVVLRGRHDEDIILAGIDAVFEEEAAFADAVRNVAAAVIGDADDIVDIKVGIFFEDGCDIEGDHVFCRSGEVDRRIYDCRHHFRPCHDDFVAEEEGAVRILAPIPGAEVCEVFRTAGKRAGGVEIDPRGSCHRSRRRVRDIRIGGDENDVGIRCRRVAVTERGEVGITAFMLFVDSDIEDDVHHASAVLTEHAGIAGVAVPYFTADVHIFDKAEMHIRHKVGAVNIQLRLRAAREVAESGRVDDREVFDDAACRNFPEEALVADGRVLDGVTVAVEGAAEVSGFAAVNGILTAQIAEDVFVFRHVDIRTEQIVTGNGILRRAFCFNEGIEGDEVFFAVDDHRDDKDGYAVFRGGGGDDDIIPAGSKTGKQEAALARAVGNVCARFCAVVEIHIGDCIRREGAVTFGNVGKIECDRAVVVCRGEVYEGLIHDAETGGNDEFVAVEDTFGIFRPVGAVEGGGGEVDRRNRRGARLVNGDAGRNARLRRAVAVSPDVLRVGDKDNVGICTAVEPDEGSNGACACPVAGRIARSVGRIVEDIDDDVYHVAAVLTEQTVEVPMAVAHLAADKDVFDKAVVHIRNDRGAVVDAGLRFILHLVAGLPAESVGVDDGEVFDNAAFGDLPEEAPVADERVFERIAVAVEGTAERIRRAAVDGILALIIAEDVSGICHVDVAEHQIVTGERVVDRGALRIDEPVERHHILRVFDQQRRHIDGEDKVCIAGADGEGIFARGKALEEELAGGDFKLHSRLRIVVEDAVFQDIVKGEAFVRSRELCDVDGNRVGRAAADLDIERAFDIHPVPGGEGRLERLILAFTDGGDDGERGAARDLRRIDGDDAGRRVDGNARDRLFQRVSDRVIRKVCDGNGGHGAGIGVEHRVGDADAVQEVIIGGRAFVERCGKSDAVLFRGRAVPADETRIIIVAAGKEFADRGIAVSDKAVDIGILDPKFFRFGIADRIGVGHGNCLTGVVTADDQRVVSGTCKVKVFIEDEDVGDARRGVGRLHGEETGIAPLCAGSQTGAVDDDVVQLAAEQADRDCALTTLELRVEEGDVLHDAVLTQRADKAVVVVIDSHVADGVVAAVEGAHEALRAVADLTDGVIRSPIADGLSAVVDIVAEDEVTDIIEVSVSHTVNGGRIHHAVFLHIVDIVCSFEDFGDHQNGDLEYIFRRADLVSGFARIDVADGVLSRELDEFEGVAVVFKRDRRIVGGIAHGSDVCRGDRIARRDHGEREGDGVSLCVRIDLYLGDRLFGEVDGLARDGNGAVSREGLPLIGEGEGDGNGHLRFRFGGNKARGADFDRCGVGAAPGDALG